MSDLNNALITLPDPDQIQHHLAMLDGEARSQLEEVYNLLKGDTPDIGSARQALQIVHDRIAELTQFGEQASGIINGLVEVSNLALKQRDQKSAQIQEMIQDFEEAVDERVAEQVEDILADDMSLDGARVNWLAERILDEGPDSVVKEEQELLKKQLKVAQELAYDMNVSENWPGTDESASPDEETEEVDAETDWNPAA